MDSLTKANDSNSQKVYQYTKAIIQKDKDEKKKKALMKRDALLKKNKPVAKLVPNKVIEESGLTCGVCYEGFTGKPNDLMGVYVYAKKV